MLDMRTTCSPDSGLPSGVLQAQLMKALQDDVRRRTCAWMARLPPLPHVKAAALQDALVKAVHNGCSGWGTVMAPALQLATELMDSAARKGSGFAMSMLCALSTLLLLRPANVLGGMPATAHWRSALCDI